MRVLVVEDDESSRYLISSLLRGYGNEVVEAVDGVDALEKARATPVDVVVTDILMPRMDGYALCREWKADPELSKAPLILYSASYTDPADQRFAESLGADAFFVKPQEPDVLVARIEEVLRKHQATAASPRSAQPREETEVLREYNERLVSKLEEKLVELADANEDLRMAINVLSDEVDVKKTLIEQLTSDVRERERAQAELRVANQTMDVVIRESPVPIVVLDPEFKVLLWNPAAEDLFQVKAEDAIGRFYPAVPEDQREEFTRMYGPLVRGEVEWTLHDVRRVRADGSTVDLLVHAVGLHQEGRVTGMLGVYQDMTEARHIEMVKSDFVSMVSHELRTPLTSLIGYSDMLEAMDVRADPDLVHRLLGKIRDRGDHMRRLIDDLIDVSQIQSGPLSLDLARVDIEELVRAQAESTPMSERHHLVFEVEGRLPSVRVDRERMRKVLSHLLDNAVKYSPEGGDVSVRLSSEGGFVRIAVSDQGVGLAPNDTRHIFDPLTQGDMSDTRSFGGVGVGLFLARQIIGAHRGRLEVDSTPGEGSTFTVFLPAA